MGRVEIEQHGIAGQQRCDAQCQAPDHAAGRPGIKQPRQKTQRIAAGDMPSNAGRPALALGQCEPRVTLSKQTLNTAHISTGSSDLSTLAQIPATHAENQPTDRHEHSDRKHPIRRAGADRRNGQQIEKSPDAQSNQCQGAEGCPMLRGR